MSRRSSVRSVVALAASALAITVSTVLAAPQEKAEIKPKTPPRIEPNRKDADKEDTDRAQAGGVSIAEAKAIIDKMIAEFDLKPRPQPTIPDDPPPHEGALVDIPVVVEPPDLLVVEVLESLPGRPISGERLVRPDGTISLGFYGDIYVRGLTRDQIKVAIIKQLRNVLNDYILGLITPEDEEPTTAKPGPMPHPPPPPDLPEFKDPVDDQGKEKAATPAGKPRASLRSPGVHDASSRIESRTGTVRRVRRRVMPQETEDTKPADKKANAVVLPLAGKGQVKITIEVQGQNAGIVVPNSPTVDPNARPEADLGGFGPAKVVHPLDSGAVFVDVSAYNSKHYYVVGDVLIPGKLPHTGSDTVLDVLQHAGGLLPTAEPKDIRLVRPGRNGKPSRVYNVDLEAIQDKGDVRTNYQLFPGDRLVVGRNEVVKKTVELDRLAAPVQSVITSIQQEVTLLKSLGMQPDQGDRVLKDLVDFWAKELTRKGDLKLDEQALRDLLLKQLKPAPANARPGLSPGSK